MVHESRNVFPKQVIGENHISGIMCENPGEARPSLLPPATDAHAC